MDQIENFQTIERVVDIAPPTKSFSKISVTLLLILFLILLAGLSFGLGFLGGKIYSDLPKGNNQQNQIKKTDLRNGNSLYSDKDNSFQVTFPTSWKSNSKSTGGAGFSDDMTSVDIFLVTDQPFVLSADQQKILVKSSKVDLTINKQKIQATEHSFKNGSIITSGNLAATDYRPKISFLINASDQKGYETAKTVVQSFIFTN